MKISVVLAFCLIGVALLPSHSSGGDEPVGTRADVATFVVWLKPNGDAPPAADWSHAGSSGCVPSTVKFCYIDDDPASDLNSTILFSMGGATGVANFTLEDLPFGDFTVTSVTVFAWSRTNATDPGGAAGFDYNVSLYVPAGRCTAIVDPHLTLAFVNVSSPILSCPGGPSALDRASINSAVLQLHLNCINLCPGDPVTVTAAGLVVEYEVVLSPSQTTWNAIDASPSYAISFPWGNAPSFVLNAVGFGLDVDLLVEWDFGDGAKSSSRNPTHSYAEPTAFASYNVSVTLCDRASVPNYMDFYDSEVGLNPPLWAFERGICVRRDLQALVYNPVLAMAVAVLIATAFVFAVAAPRLKARRAVRRRA